MASLRKVGVIRFIMDVLAKAFIPERCVSWMKDLEKTMARDAIESAGPPSWPLIADSTDHDSKIHGISSNLHLLKGRPSPQNTDGFQSSPNLEY